MCQCKFGRIERRIEVEVVHTHEETQVRAAREGAGKARVIASGGRERADASTGEIEDAVAVAAERELPAQVGLVCRLQTAGKIVLVEVDRSGDDAEAPAAASAADRGRHKPAHPRIRARQSAVLLAHQFAVEAVQGNAQVVVYEEGFGETRQAGEVRDYFGAFLRRHTVALVERVQSTREMQTAGPVRKSVRRSSQSIQARVSCDARRTGSGWAAA